MTKIAVVVGNPKPASRTLGVARAVAATIGSGLESAEVEVLDLAADLPGLLDPQDPAVAAARDRVLEADLTVVASPTFKATYTGLLKLFLDQFGAGSFGGRLAVPVMTAGAPVHALAADLHLRPLLLELGASLPTRAVFVLESQLPDVGAVVASWWEGASRVVVPVLESASAPVGDRG